MSYWVAVVARNSISNLKPTLDSLMHQTVPPTQIIVVDDGSTDGTGEMLSEYAGAHPRLVTVITLPDKGYDIRRVPSNVNLASKSAAELKLDTSHFMISGDDCTYPEDYVESIIRKMHGDERIVVASGRPSSGGIVNLEHTPSGSGRVVVWDYWRRIGGAYPAIAGWETWLLNRAEQLGFKVKLFPELVFEHSRPRGTKHNFVYWGAAMRTLGYHPLYAFGRIAKNILVGSNSVKGSLNLLRGYIQAYVGSSDPFVQPFELSLRTYVRASQVRRIRSVLSTLLHAKILR
jgi:glycosyltransferase involved in cell wall biosynthesis